MLLGKMLAEHSPIIATPILLSDEASFLSIPTEQLNAVQEGVVITLADVIIDSQPVGNPYSIVVGVPSRAGIAECKVYVLGGVVGE